MENQRHQEPATPEEIWKILREVSKEQIELSRQMQESKLEDDRLKLEADRRMQEADRQREETERAIQETAQQLKETDQQLQESKLEADRRMQETDRVIQETSREVKATARQLKKTDAHFNSQWGKLMESLVEGDLVPLLQARGMTVDMTSTNAKGVRNGHHYEFDILVVNGEQVMVVEVKTTLRPKDVAYFLKKLAVYTTWAPGHKGKQILGAVAYLKADSSVTTYAERQGLYVIRATGSSASIINEKDFQPKVFQ